MNAQLKRFYHEMDHELKSIMAWWSNHAFDEQNGGFWGEIYNDNTINKDADKGIILYSRILWSFSGAAHIDNNAEYKKIAERAYRFINTNFIDGIHGGAFWMLSSKGDLVSAKKQIYAQAFCIYAFTEYYKINPDKEVLEKAMALFQLIEEQAYDRKHGGYVEAFNREWKLISDMRLSDKDANEAKTMNTHLHILEAYTNLYRVNGSTSVKMALANLIDLFIKKFIGSSGHLHLFFEEDWTLKSNEISFGHDIECAWLLVEAAEVIGDIRLIEKTKALALKIADITMAEGNAPSGGLYNESNGSNITDAQMDWWPQAEAVVGFYCAFQISNDEKYLAEAWNKWEFIKTHILNHENGEWYWGVDQRLNPVNISKAGPWKAPYHNGRMCMEMMRRLAN